jgi:uncharacterized membrane protein (UPF0127 family)
VVSVEVTLRHLDGRPVCERCTVAKTPFARMRGLLGRSRLEAGEGIWLEPASSIHTAFMRFPIDAVFLDADRVVVKVAAEVRPWRASAFRRARAVLELPAGEAARRGLSPGTALRAAT